jgi:hypothetical protein
VAFAGQGVRMHICHEQAAPSRNRPCGKVDFVIADDAIGKPPVARFRKGRPPRAES